MNVISQAPVDAVKLRVAIVAMVGRYGESERAAVYAQRLPYDRAKVVLAERAADRRFRAVQRLTHALLAMTIEEGAR